MIVIMCWRCNKRMAYAQNAKPQPRYECVCGEQLYLMRGEKNKHISQIHWEMAALEPAVLEYNEDGDDYPATLT